MNKCISLRKNYVLKKFRKICQFPQPIHRTHRKYLHCGRIQLSQIPVSTTHLNIVELVYKQKTKGFQHLKGLLNHLHQSSPRNIHLNFISTALENEAGILLSDRRGFGI